MLSRASAKLPASAIPAVNDWLGARADDTGFLPRWHDVRMVAADMSRMRFGPRTRARPNPANADLIALALRLPATETMLAGSRHSAHENNRQTLSR